MAGKMKHMVFTDEMCFQSIHLMHAVLSYIIFLIFAGITVFTIYVNYENRYSKNPIAK